MRLCLDDPDVGLVKPDSLQDRYKVTVELVVVGNSVDDAQEAVKDIIEHGILGLIDTEDSEPIDEWDILEAEPAEVL